MNAAQITHIFWKEYRTQRGLWLVFVGLFFALAVAGTLFVSEHSRLGVNSLVQLAFVLVVIYLLASTSILYSSEREQQTDHFLRTLPTSPWTLLVGKLAWVGLSSLVAIALCALVAYLFAARESISGFDYPGAQAITILYLFSCCLIASLLTRNVLTSLVVSGVLVTIGSVLIGYIGYFDRLNPFSDYRLVWIGAIIVLSATSIELNRRFCRESEWNWDLRLRLGRATTLAAAIAEAEYSNSTWRRHVWREWRTARLWLTGLAFLALCFAVVTMEGIFESEARFIHFAGNMCLVPLLAGIGSCRGEQAHQQFRFLGNRGVSAAQVLCVKHAVWLGGCTLILIFVTLYASASPQSVPSNLREQLAGSLEWIPISTELLSSARAEQLSQSLIPAIMFWGSVSLLLYSLGHFLSLLLVQPILALMVSFFLSILVTFVVVFYYAWGVPLFILAIIPAACLLSLSFYRGEDWLAGRNSARDWKRFCVFAVLGLWTIVTLLASWRVLEIPWSTVVDTNGLYNLPTWYMFGCFFGLLFLTTLLWFVDWLRATFHVPSGTPKFVVRRWCTFGTLVVTFLIAHNLLSLVLVRTYNAGLSRQTTPLRRVVLDDLEREARTSLHEKRQSEILEWSIGSRPFPLADDARSDRYGRKKEPARTQWSSWADVTEEQRFWLSDHPFELTTFFELDGAGVVNSTELRPASLPLNPAVVLEYAAYRPLSFFEESRQKLLLVRLEALRLEHEGQLAEAWRHHLAVVRYVRRFADHNFPAARWEAMSWLDEIVLKGDLWRWQARREQTPELLVLAARELHAEISELSPLAEAVRRDAGWSLVYLDNLSSRGLIFEDILAAGMPWEKRRLRSLILEQLRLAVQLAEQIDRGKVRLARHYNPGYSETYNFDVVHHDSVAGKRYSIYLDVNRPKGVYDLQMSAIYSASRPAPPKSRAKRLWYRNGPPSKTETTIIAPDFPSRTTAIVEPYIPPSAVNQRLPGILLSELDFWNSLRWSMWRFSIYSFRAETGHFPADLNRLRHTRTSEVFQPLIPDIALTLPETEMDQLSKVASVLKYDQHLDPAIADYTWFHARTWPQPEYNIGETPDWKPVAPLRAPESEETRP